MVRVNRLARRLALGLTVGLAAGCAAPVPTAGDGVPRLRITTRIALANMCSGSQSPPIAIANAPAGTTQYRIRISNVSVLRQTPTEWTIDVPAEPGLVPLGALPGYSGPCPGDLLGFTYRFEVLALGEDGGSRGYGFTEIRVRSVNELAQDTWRRGAQSKPIDPAEPPAFDADETELFRTRRRPDDIFRDERTRPEDGMQPPLLLR